MPTALRVFLPFALAYLLSYIFRVVNAVAGEPVATEFGLTPADLGLMTSLYFLGFVFTQIPLGILMDRYGPRRVESLTWLVATAGCLVFATGAVAEQLFLGRFLIGVGASMALMGPMTAYRHWFTPERRALVIGLHMACGGLGSAIGGGPTEAALEVLGWRDLFFLLAAGTLFVSILLFTVVPRRHEPSHPTDTRRLLREVGTVLTSRTLWRIAPLSAMIQIGMLSVISLWSGPWLRQVVGLPSGEAAVWLSANSIGLITGFLVYGLIFSHAEKRGLSTHVLIVGAFVIMAVQLGFIALPPEVTPPLWILFAMVGSVAVHSYNIASSEFPLSMAGRVNTALNLIVFLGAFLGQWGFGLILDGWRNEAGGVTREGFQVAFVTLIVLQLLAMLPMLLPKSKPMKVAAPH